VTEAGFEQNEIDEFIEKARHLLPGTKIDVNIVEDIPLSGSGKHRYTIRNFPLR
jgi:hypothetical protein